MAERKTFIRKIKQGDKIRYAEVWNERRGKKVIQHHVRYLGSVSDNLPDPSSFDIEKIHLGYLAQLIHNDTLFAGDVYLMLDATFSYLPSPPLVDHFATFFPPAKSGHFFDNVKRVGF